MTTIYEGKNWENPKPWPALFHIQKVRDFAYIHLLQFNELQFLYTLNVLRNKHETEYNNVYYDYTNYRFIK